MNKEMNDNVLVDFINNAQPDAGWWHIVPSLTNAQKEKILYDLFPPINEIFGINTIAMKIFSQKIGWHIQHGKIIKINRRCIEDMRVQVINRAHFEASSIIIDGVRNAQFIKIGVTHDNPVSIYSKRKTNERL